MDEADSSSGGEEFGDLFMFPLVDDGQNYSGGDSAGVAADNMVPGSDADDEADGEAETAPARPMVTLRQRRHSQVNISQNGNTTCTGLQS